MTLVNEACITVKVSKFTFLAEDIVIAKIYIRGVGGGCGVQTSSKAQSEGYIQQSKDKYKSFDRKTTRLRRWIEVIVEVGIAFRGHGLVRLIV